MGSIADRMAGMGTPAKKSGFGGVKGEPMGGEMKESGSHSELHPHGDGTYHSVMDGEKTEHPSFGHAMMHMAMKHEPEGGHSHVHHTEEGEHISHHGKDGEISGPHTSENLDEVKNHMAKVAGEHEGTSEPEPAGSMWD